MGLTRHGEQRMGIGTRGDKVSVLSSAVEAIDRLLAARGDAPSAALISPPTMRGGGEGEDASGSAGGGEVRRGDYLPCVCVCLCVCVCVCVFIRSCMCSCARAFVRVRLRAHVVCARVRDCL